jgi:hypothetical protein
MTLLVLWLMLSYVYVTFDRHCLLLWQRKCRIRSFFLERVGRNLRFAQCDIIIIIIVVMMAVIEEVRLTGDFQHVGFWYS